MSSEKPVTAFPRRRSTREARASALLAVALAAVACTRASVDPGPVRAKQEPSAAGAGLPARPARADRPEPADPALDHELVGTSMPEWTAEDWVNSPPLTLTGLHGRVVLVRWFMGTSCPMCSATAPSLNALHRELASKGLTVVGMYHHKEEGPLRPGEFADYVRSFGFGFPVARDPEWTTLRAWWLTGHDREFTSVSFLLDRQGRVRGIHPGGRYAPGDADYQALRRGIEKLLADH